MLSEFFYWVLNMSIMGSVTGLIMLTFRQIKKLPKFSVYILWLLPLIRLWIPFGLANQYSLLNFISRFTTKTVVWEGRLAVPQFSMSNSIQAADSYFPIEYKTDLLKDIFNVASIVWIIVAAAVILTSVLLYISTKYELKSVILLQDNIYKCDRITAPAV